MIDPEEMCTPEEALLELESRPNCDRLELYAAQLTDDALGLPEPLYTVGSLLSPRELVEWRRANYRGRAALVVRTADRAHAPKEH